MKEEDPLLKNLPNIERITSSESREQQAILDAINKKAKLPKCSVCAKNILPEDDQFMLQSTECFHPAHQGCLRQDILKQLKKSNSAHCRLCEMEILCWEYNEYLTKEEQKEIDEWEIAKLR